MFNTIRLKQKTTSQQTITPTHTQNVQTTRMTTLTSKLQQNHALHLTYTVSESLAK